VVQWALPLLIVWIPSVKRSEVIAYEDLGAEAIYKFYVEDFPVIVVIDSIGNNLYKTEPLKYIK